MVGDDYAGALQPLGLVGEEVAALVVSVVGNDHAGGNGSTNWVGGAVQLLYQLSRLATWSSTHV